MTAVVGCVAGRDEEDEKVGSSESAFGGRGEYTPLGLTCEAGKVMVTSAGRDRCTYRFVGQTSVDARPTFSVKAHGQQVESPSSRWSCEVTFGAGTCNISAEPGQCLEGEPAGGEKPCTPPVDAVTRALQINPRDGQTLIVTVANDDPNNPTTSAEDRAIAECQSAYNNATVAERDQIIAQACREEVTSLNGIDRAEPLLCCVTSPVKADDGDSRSDAGAPTCTAPKELFVKSQNVNLCTYHVEDVTWDPLTASRPLDDAMALEIDRTIPGFAGTPQSHRFTCAPKVACNLVASRLRCDPYEEASGRRPACPNGSGETAEVTGLGSTFELPDRLVTTYESQQDVRFDPVIGTYERAIQVPVQRWEVDWEAARTICRDHLYSVIQTKTQEEVRRESWAACRRRAEAKSSSTRGSLSCCKDPKVLDGGGGAQDGGGGEGGTPSDGGFPDAQQMQLPSYGALAPRDGGAG